MDKPVLLIEQNTAINRADTRKAALALAESLRDCDDNSDQDYLLYQIEKAADLLEMLVSISKHDSPA